MDGHPALRSNRSENRVLISVSCGTSPSVNLFWQGKKCSLSILWCWFWHNPNQPHKCRISTVVCASQQYLKFSVMIRDLFQLVKNPLGENQGTCLQWSPSSAGGLLLPQWLLCGVPLGSPGEGEGVCSFKSEDWHLLQVLLCSPYQAEQSQPSPKWEVAKQRVCDSPSSPWDLTVFFHFLKPLVGRYIVSFNIKSWNTTVRY